MTQSLFEMTAWDKWLMLGGGFSAARMELRCSNGGRVALTCRNEQISVAGARIFAKLVDFFGFRSSFGEQRSIQERAAWVGS